MTTAPNLDAWSIIEGLLADLGPLEKQICLVIDDIHDLAPDVLRQLELLILRAPWELRFVLATRHDVSLGLHRLRLDGGLAEIRRTDLWFSLDEARELFAAAGITLSAPALALLHERTEGWPAGLRLAALSLGGQQDAERFAAEFSGYDRTVSEYLLAEVLNRQSDPMRRLLLRTSILDQVNGELADLLTGESGSERMLQDLEDAGAFVISQDRERRWFRYHQLFAALLQSELRRCAPDQMAGLHRAACGWFEAHGCPAEAIRHAQAAQDWTWAAGLLADHWLGMYLNGQSAVTHELISAFPAKAVAAHPGLAAVVAADELAHGSLDAAERYLALAERHSTADRSGRAERTRLMVSIARLVLARQRGNVQAVLEETDRVESQALAVAEATWNVGEVERTDLRAFALISLGITEWWASAVRDEKRHLDQGVALARQNGRHYLEFLGLAYLAPAHYYQSFEQTANYARQAIELAKRHGWTNESAAGVACMMLAIVLTWQGRPQEAESWTESAERTLRAESHPGSGLTLRFIRGAMELVRGRDAEALAAFEATEPLAALMSQPHYLLQYARALRILALVRLGEIERAEQFLDNLSAQDREPGEIRLGSAILHLAQGDPRAATLALAPVMDCTAPITRRTWLASAYVVEAVARKELGDAGPAMAALDHALELAETDRAAGVFLLYPDPVSELLDRRIRLGTPRTALIAEINKRLAERNGQGDAGDSRKAVTRPTVRLVHPLSGSELRVLRYLPTNLSLPEIATELMLSPNTIKTHVRNIYAKFGVGGRSKAVAAARDLGLLAPASTGRASPIAA